MIAALIVAAGCVAALVSFKLFETDFWHHLLVGRVIWEQHSVPTRQLWSWPTYGAPEANSAWLFRTLVWPFWAQGSVFGLFLWRWLTTLAAFGLMVAAARRMGARGFAPLVALVLCVFVYRLRSQIRPETLVAILVALQILILETRRRGGGDHAWWLVLIAWIWANAHVSYYLGFVILGVYALEAWLTGRRGGWGGGRQSGGVRRLLLVAIASIAVSFVNPFGWRALWQPFDFSLHLRHEIMYRTIVELKPVDWRRYIHTVLPVLVGGWTALILWRAATRRFDRVEALLCAGFTALALSTQRFLGFYTLIAAPFLMRDLGDWISARRWPRWTASPWTRGALTIVVLVAVSIPELRRFDLPLGIGVQWDHYPVRACDWIAAHDVKGRGFNNFEYGGYQAWRFWPERARLPFMTGTIEAATPEDRYLYAGVFARPLAWKALDERHRFDYILMERVQEGDNRLLDHLDADSTWALVFADDAGTVYLRRTGSMAALAAAAGPRPLPASNAGLAALARAMMSDSALVRRVEAALKERVAGSPWNSRDLGLLANVELALGRPEDARRRIESALRVNPDLDRGHMLLGMIALADQRPRDAVDELMRQRERTPDMPGVAIRLGQAWQRLGDLEKARTWYRRELALDSGNREVLDSLASVGAKLGD